MPLTPGVETSEYKLTVLAMWVGTVAQLAAGVIHELAGSGVFSESSRWAIVVLAICGTLVQICALFGYAKSRTLLKLEAMQGEVTVFASPATATTSPTLPAPVPVASSPK